MVWNLWKCRLKGSVCNNKQRWDKGKCYCGCKKWIDKGICDKAFVWNPSNCECESGISCLIGKYWDYEK